jgi:hypothetical protein
MFRIAADYSYNPLALDNFAIIAHLLYT